MFIPEIDVEHQEMFRLAAELRQAVLAGEKSARLDVLRRRLASEVNGHFAHEERLMRAAGYPSYKWHERQHQAARVRLAALAQGICDGERQPIFECLEGLAGCIRDHISVADRMAGAYLRNHWRGGASS